jgi:hypothetical protein
MAAVREREVDENANLREKIALVNSSVLNGFPEKGNPTFSSLASNSCLYPQLRFKIYTTGPQLSPIGKLARAHRAATPDQAILKN